MMTAGKRDKGSLLFVLEAESKKVEDAHNSSTCYLLLCIASANNPRAWGGGDGGERVCRVAPQMSGW